MNAACRYESEIIRAAEEDRWTDALREHLRGCDDCVAAASAAPWMDRFAHISDREHILPDPSVVWLKAKLLQTTADANRASRPIDTVQMIAYAIVAAGWAGLVMWRWDDIERWVRSFSPTGLIESAARAEQVSLSFFGMVFVLASMTVMLALHTILAED
ncbi:MAG TPA: hypothetical protein VEK79_18410 [Thermoanaerobaculia bacterium]|nr:hypothetical protein [Thermoanaerobaculia bacterium]